ncbi:MAG: hypothetical protein RR710_08770 [Oscillospiraceae bacterium]
MEYKNTIQDNKQSKDLKDHRKIKVGIIVLLIVIILKAGILIVGGKLASQKNNGEAKYFEELMQTLQ